MEQESKTSKTKYLTAAILIAAVAFFAFLFINQSSQGDADFCRMIWDGMRKGNERVIRDIDWEHLNLLGRDIGARYGLAKTDEERNKYKQNFLRGVAFGNRRYARVAPVFKNWRVYYSDSAKTVVAVDSVRRRAKTQTLFFTVSKGGAERKLVAIEFGGYGQ
ncbi:MAG: hypothetical protein ABSB18_08070 [Candidatus Omnitrophota bacterium]